MKLTLPKMDKLINDKNVLYAVFIIAILNVLGYLLAQNVDAIAFFLIIGFLSTYFSKNMIVVLMIAIVTTSIFNITRGKYVEGMSTRRNDKTKQKGKEDKKETKKVDDKKEEEHEPEGMTTVTNKAKKPNKLDYAGTLEKAYENLQNTIGDGGIEGLTSQTKTLLDQQKNLMDNIKGMEPFLQTAESFMNKLDLSSLEGLGGMLSKFTGKKEDKSK
jgi:hypothetical protein